jgi:general stress protein YciG
MPTSKKTTGDKHSESGKKGSGSGGNFANDHEKASEAGKKGGSTSHSSGSKK